MMKRRYRLSTLEAARRWLFLLCVIFFVTGLIMTGMIGLCPRPTSSISLSFAVNRSLHYYTDDAR